MRTPHASGRRACSRHCVQRHRRRLPQRRAYDGVGAPRAAGHVEAERAARVLGGGQHLALGALVAAAAIAAGGGDRVLARSAVPHHRAGAAVAEGDRAPDGGQPDVAQDGQLLEVHVAFLRALHVVLPLPDGVAGFLRQPAVDGADVVVQVVKALLHLADHRRVGERRHPHGRRRRRKGRDGEAGSGDRWDGGGAAAAGRAGAPAR